MTILIIITDENHTQKSEDDNRMNITAGNQKNSAMGILY